MVEINEAYTNGDLDKLKEYMKMVGKEERIAKETSEEKLVRLKEEYNVVISIIVKLQAETDSLKTSNLFKLYEEVQQAKIKGMNLLEKMAKDAQKEITEKEGTLQCLLRQYDALKSKVGWHD